MSKSAPKRRGNHPSLVYIEERHSTLEKLGQYQQEGLRIFVIIVILMVRRVEVINLASTLNLGTMKITINKKDFERVLDALSIAEDSVKGTRSEEMFRLTRKKLKRQNK